MTGNAHSNSRSPQLGQIKKMSKWLKSVLFGRQLSHGSENEDPQSFEEAFQPQNVEQMPNLVRIASLLTTMDYYGRQEAVARLIVVHAM